MEWDCMDPTGFTGFARIRTRTDSSTSPGGLLSMSDVWQQLVTGQMFIARTYATVGRCFVLTESRDRPRRAAPQELAVLERVLTGEQPKVVAAELGVSLPTVCQYCRNALDTFCNFTTPSRASTFIVMAAFAGQGITMPSPVFHGVDHSGYTVLSVALPDAELRCRLSKTELTVAHALIQGKSHAEICAERGTSPRTVANQLSSIYRKLGVSGRREFLTAILSQSSPAENASCLVSNLSHDFDRHADSLEANLEARW